MRNLLIVLLFFCVHSYAQIPFDEEQFVERLRNGNALPEQLLSSRTVVIHPFGFTDEQLTEIQQSFQRTGIDAVAYFKMDQILAGRDVAIAMADYFNSRYIANLVIFQKSADQFKVYITQFNKTETFTDSGQVAWTADNKSLTELLKNIYRSASAALKRENLLINDVPETNLPLNPIRGRRSDFFAIDLKVDQLAVPKFGDDAMDQQLAELFKDYPFKYKLTEPGLSDKELRQQGNLYVLSYVHTRGSVARELLGYDMSKNESAYVSVTYPEGEEDLKSIPANVPVYKFYFKHIDSGNVFLGTKWDADIDWHQALKNHITAFKKELRIN